MTFQDRHDAGRALARELLPRVELCDAVVLALPRGGVPVACEVASALHLPLDVLVVRKLGLPGQEELALGAVAGSGVRVLNLQVVRAFSIREEEIDAIEDLARREIARREALYRGDRPAIDVQGRSVILVDDGLATGSTMTAAVRSLRQRARRIVVAVPVGSRQACDELRREADEVVCLDSPQPFQAVGQFYLDFEQTRDTEVAELLAEAGRSSSA